MGEVQKLPIDQLKKAVALALAFANAIDESGRGKGVMMKAMPFMGLADELAALEGASWTVVVAQLKDLDAVERAEIKALIASKLDLKDDQLEGAIENLIGIVNDGVNLFLSAKELLAKRK